MAQKPLTEFEILNSFTLTGYDTGYHIMMRYLKGLPVGRYYQKFIGLHTLEMGIEIVQYFPTSTQKNIYKWSEIADIVQRGFENKLSFTPVDTTGRQLQFL